MVNQLVMRLKEMGVDSAAFRRPGIRGSLPRLVLAAKGDLDQAILRFFDLKEESVR